VSHSVLGLFGKIPAENDFVGVHDEGWRDEDLDDWLQQSQAALERFAVRLPANKPTTLLLRRRGASFAALVVPGTDRSGRPFPTAVFEPLDSTSPERCAVFALEGNPFAQAAARVLELAAKADVNGLERCLSEVSGGLLERLANAELGVGESLRRAAARPLLELLGDSASYAFSTLRMACEEARNGVDESLLVRCPAGDATARVFWIVLAGRWLRPGGSAFVIVDGNGGADLELCFGEPPPELVALALVPLPVSSLGHWLLMTSTAEARESAESNLSKSELQALRDPRATLADLLGAFAP